jgi:FMN phosphatase YigB (HAD superfamily)
MRKAPIFLFDVMDTLVAEPFYEAMPAFFGMTLDELLAAKHPTSWCEFEKGELSEDEFLANFFLDRRPVDRDGLRQCATDTYGWLDGMKVLLQELHGRGYSMHALSNYPIWYEMIEEKLGLGRYLEWSFVSCRTGLRKPDPQAFIHAAKVLGAPTHDCLFIDDRPVNVEAARAVGMDALHMSGIDVLRRQLQERRII